MSAFDAEGLDVGAESFGDSEPVDGQQRYERVLSGGCEPGGDEEGADLVAVQVGGVGLVVQAGPPDMRCR